MTGVTHSDGFPPRAVVNVARRTVSRADYARAESFLPWNVRPLIHNATVTPHWLDDGSDRFWYRRTSPEGAAFVLVDPATATREPAFDHVRLAAALSEASGRACVHTQLPFEEIRLVDGGQTLGFSVDGQGWTCDLETYACARSDWTEPAKDELRSPDGAWAAFTRGGNLFVREVASGREQQLTDDAEPYYDYASHPDARQSAVTDRALGKPLPPAAVWSPDSRRLLTYRLDQRSVGEMHLLQSVPPDGSFRPVLHRYRYPLPGDASAGEAALLIVDVPSGDTRWLQTPPLSDSVVVNPFELGQVWWSKDGKRIYVVRGTRDRRHVALEVVDADSGAARTVLEESGSTTTYPHHIVTESPINTVHELDGGRAVTWFSTRSGWGHLYVHDATTGAVRRPLTSGPWTVREVVRLDADGGWLYFTAGGREPERDPYLRHLYRVRVDGSELALLTPEDAEHGVTFSPSGAFFLDTHSRIDLAPVTVLRAAAGEQVLTLEEADVSGLAARGWSFPERVRVMARDGVTPLYGMVIRPSTFDPQRRYPVLDAIYPGPQTIRTPKAFPDVTTQFWQDQALAELGFLVVTLDGQGTPYRWKAFHDVAYGTRFGEAGGLADHVAGLRQLAERDESLDLERVGIYGHSGGGYASTRALLEFPDFYKVAVSSAGNHDQRGYVAFWAETWMGRDPESWTEQDNIQLARRLQGKLLLVHGELDDNVHPSLTLRLVDALITADKDFDLLIIPNTNHGLFDTRRGLKAQANARAYGNPYFVRRRWDYFVRHLVGVEPPEYHLTPPAD
ncbi:MAG TPA: DPP IV N-terminal domain-containing protein [Thermomicrobiaceae bacterium]|nr:DPP IV N-terminal domain-containing protein [Thermomicrobiaceae bacterium]